MFKSIIANTITALTAAAFAATLTLFVMPVAVPEAKAHSQVTGVLPAPPVADGRLAVGRGNVCSSLGWPHYEQSCLFDLRTPAKDVTTVRVIVLR
jgi:hypothetical protein